MSELAIQQPELIGREEELNKLKQSLANAIASKGSTLFIAGEAGIGKTRLVSELIKEADAKNIQIIQGRCLLESLEPLMSIKTALREAGLFHLISGDPPPLVVSAYLMNDAGLLVAKAEREELGLDPYIFSSMLKAVGSFVKDSMRMVDNIDRTGGLNSIGYQEFKIIMEESAGLHLAVVTKGNFSEFLVSDMRRVLADVHSSYGRILKDWDGDMGKVRDIDPMISKLITAGKYNGKFLVDDPRIRQENVFDNVLLGLQRLSATKPLLLFLDDLHWADPSTLALINYLARNTKNDKVLIVGDYRPEDIVQDWDGKPHRLDGFMQNMSREELLEKIELNRLDRKGTEELVEKTLGKVNFTLELYDRIFKETEGTPFFVLEVVKLLAEEGWITQDDKGTWSPTTGLEKMDIPSKVYDVIKRRLDRLKKDQREILDCASVVGEEFRTDIIGKTMDLNKLALLKNLSDIEKTHKLIHSMEKKFRFDHAKVRAVLYDEIIDELKLEYHKLIADTILELHKDNLDEVLSELAIHYYKAKDGKAGEYLIKAADKAKERYANEEAIRFYDYALEVLEDEELIKKVHEELGDAHLIIGQSDETHNHYKAAYEREKEKRKIAHLHRKIAEAYRVQDKREACLQECEKGLVLLEGEACIEVARLLSVKGNSIFCHSKEDWKLTRRIYNLELKIATDLNDIKEIARAHFNLGNMYFEESDDSLDNQYKEALFHLETALKYREELEDEKEISDSLLQIGLLFHNRGNAMWGEHDNWDKAIHYYTKGLTIKRKIGDNEGASFILLGIGILNRNRDDFEQTLQYYHDSLQLSFKSGIKSRVWQTYWFFGELCELKGDVDGALSHYMKTHDYANAIEDYIYIASSLESIGKLYANIGKFDDAIEQLKNAINIVKADSNSNDFDYSYFFTQIGRIHHQRGELDKSLSILHESLNTGCPEKAILVDTLIYLAEVYLDMNMISESLTNAKKALEICKEKEFHWKELQSYQTLGMIYRQNKKWEMAIECFENSKKLLDNSPFGLYECKSDHGRLFLEYGLLWKAMGDHAKAKEHLEEALKLYSELNWKLWTDKCRAALADPPPQISK